MAVRQLNLLGLVAALTAVLLGWYINYILRMVRKFIKYLEEVLHEEV